MRRLTLILLVGCLIAGAPMPTIAAWGPSHERSLVAQAAPDHPAAGEEDFDGALTRFRLAFGKARLSGHPLSERDDAFHLFAEILERVTGRYVRATDPSVLVDKAIEGLRKHAASTTARTDVTLVEAALEAMLSSLDPYSAYLNQVEYRGMQAVTQGEFGGLGIELTADEKSGLIRVVSPIDGTPADRAGIRAGDLITRIDGTEVKGLSLREAVNRMRGDTGSRVRLALRREGVAAPINVSLVRAIIKIEPIRFHEEGDVGYIRITTFNQNTATSLDHAVDAIKDKLGPRLTGLVLDLRDNPGGLLDQAIAVADRFLVADEIVSVRGRDPSETRSYPADPGDAVAGLPIVVLINGGSASASEIVAAALQDRRRAVLFGTRSYGKGSVQTVSPLPGGDVALRLTTARYFRPSGGLVDCFGVTPNVEVRTGTARTPEPHQSQTNCDPHAPTPPLPPTWGAQNLCPHVPQPGKPDEDRPLDCALEAIRGYLVAHR